MRRKKEKTEKERKPKERKPLVISLGGSVIVPSDVDYVFLKKFKKLVLEEAKKRKVVICTGGGKTARNYIEALGKVRASNYEKDSIGIAATRLNATLLSFFLGLHGDISLSLKEVKKCLKKNNIVICGGIRPGVTTDGITAEIAKALHASMLVNITNVKGLYDKNPVKYKDAKLIRKISYKGFTKMLRKVKEKPGQHFVLDSYCTDIIQKEKIIAVILCKNIANIEKFLKGKRFVGTTIS